MGPSSSPSMQPGAIIDRFEILDLLGKGGFGEVWKARDQRLNRLVAIKRLPRGIAPDDISRERLRREALAAGSLNHPNICTVHDLATLESEYLLVMECLEGRTVHEILRGGAMAPDQAVDVAIAIAGALGEAHRHGIIHRDIKSSNVIVTTAGQVKVLDFGLARHVDGAPAATGSPTEAILTRQGSTVGTLQYMSPEQLLGEELDGRTDVFSLGVLLAEMLTGKLLFQGSSAVAVSDAILHRDAAPVLRDLHVPRALQKVILKAVAKRREDRYATADDLAADLRRLSKGASGRSGARIAVVAASVLVAIVSIVAVATMWRRSSRLATLRNTQAEIQRLIAAGDFVAANDLIAKAELMAPADAMLAKLRSEATVPARAQSIPPGAEVQYRPVGAPGSQWKSLGRTPFEKLLVPRDTYFEWRISKEGFVPVVRVMRAGLVFPIRFNLKLPPSGTVPADMTFVQGRKYTLSIPGLDHLDPVDLPDFTIDRYEVSNEQFQRFVDAGGYEKPEYWREPFVKNGKRLSFAEAMTQFVDATGKPGPANWELGSFPSGRGKYPVSGVSWYEAAAYARFAGKRLPTIFHWNGAAMPQGSVAVVPRSNFGRKGVAPTGEERGISGAGLYDAAGNVKEWCSNAAEQGKRYILGGAWNEPDYMFLDQDAQSAWSREATFGFRCMISSGPIPAEAERAIWIPLRDYSKEKPVSDEVFSVMKAAFAYDKTPLDAKLVRRDPSPEHWVLEVVSVAAAYGQERLNLYVYLPKNARPPYQPVLLFPGSNAIHTPEVPADPNPYASAIPQSGRALILPIYKGTFERRDALNSDYPAPTAFYRDHVIAWRRDLGRAIDYIETRPDMDASKVALFGHSWGGVMASILPAVEPRIKVNVVLVGGFSFQRAMPEADQINFAPRITQPTIMMGARYDQFFPVETSQQPLYRMLGTPEKDKKYVLYDSGHATPRTEVVKETVAWLDRYLGRPLR